LESACSDLLIGRGLWELGVTRGSIVVENSSYYPLSTIDNLS